MVVFESHSVARTGADLNYFSEKILNIDDFCLYNNFFELFEFDRTHVFCPSDEERRILLSLNFIIGFKTSDWKLGDRKHYFGSFMCVRCSN